MLQANGGNCRSFVLVWCCSFGICSNTMLQILFKERFWGGDYLPGSAKGFSPCPCDSDGRLFNFGSICIFFIHLCLPCRRAMSEFRPNSCSLNLHFQISWCQQEILRHPTPASRTNPTRESIRGQVWKDKKDMFFNDHQQKFDLYIVFLCKLISPVKPNTIIHFTQHNITELGKASSSQ